MIFPVYGHLVQGIPVSTFDSRKLSIPSLAPRTAPSEVKGHGQIRRGPGKKNEDFSVTNHKGELKNGPAQ